MLIFTLKMKKISKYLFSLFSLLGMSFLAIAQIETNEYPPSFYQAELTSNQKAQADWKVELAKPNLATLKAEDQVEDPIKDIPWRFGQAIDVSYDLDEDGVWQNHGNQSKIWRLKIKAKGANSLNLNFSAFHLSKHAKLFIYNADYSDVLGALTHQNNKADSLFATRPIRGDELVLELIVPEAELEENSIKIKQVVYGYRDIFDKALKSFGSSGSCNINVNCTEGGRWDDVKRSIVLILRSNNTRVCTGALINSNTTPKKPFVLTAAHCGLQTSSVFVFNYESANCRPNTDGSLSNSISNAFLRATRSTSDFTLFELSSSPPSSYNVYYAAWNNQDQASKRSTAIHHPSNDVMKISFDHDSVKESGYYSSGTSHWQVSNWERGTTEGGSSGSPLFDQYQRIVGQLHGGDAACGNRLQDFYGKFSQSWNASSAANSQLQNWLDPNNSGLSSISGFDPNAAPFNYDLELLHIYDLPRYSCDSLQSGRIVLKNKGANPINAINFNVKLNGSTVAPISWTGNLLRNELISLPLNTINFLNGNNNVEITLNNLGTNTDQNSSNDTLRASIFMNNQNAQTVNLTFKTDDYGSELSWNIRQQGESLFIHSSPPYPDINGGRVYRESLCLYDSCFTFSLNDSYGDGFNGNFGNGYLLLTDLNGDTLIFENNFRGSQTTYNFCLNTITSIEEIRQETNLKLYPNPIKAGETIGLGNTSGQDGIDFLELRNLNGKKILNIPNSKEGFTLPSNLAKGIYFINASSSKKIYPAEKLVIY